MRGDSAVYTMTPDGTMNRALLTGRNGIWGLHWSPDSDYIMFVEDYVPNVIEAIFRPVCSNRRMTMLRLHEVQSLPVYWFGAHGGSDVNFGWILDYKRFCEK